MVARLVYEEVLGEGPDVDVAAGSGNGDAQLLLRGAETEGGVASRDTREGCAGRGSGRAAAHFVGEGEVCA